jgi:hypothetical protein
MSGCRYFGSLTTPMASPKKKQKNPLEIVAEIKELVALL